MPSLIASGRARVCELVRETATTLAPLALTPASVPPMRPRLGATYPFVKCGSRRQCLPSVVSRQPFPGQHNVAISSYPNLQASVWLLLKNSGIIFLLLCRTPIRKVDAAWPSKNPYPLSCWVPFFYASRNPGILLIFIRTQSTRY